MFSNNKHLNKILKSPICRLKKRKVLPEPYGPWVALISVS